MDDRGVPEGPIRCSALTSGAAHGMFNISPSSVAANGLHNLYYSGSVSVVKVAIDCPQDLEHIPIILKHHAVHDMFNMPESPGLNHDLMSLCSYRVYCSTFSEIGLVAKLCCSRLIL